MNKLTLILAYQALLGLPSVNHLKNSLLTLQNGLPHLEAGLLNLQTDVGRIQARMKLAIKRRNPKANVDHMFAHNNWPAGKEALANAGSIASISGHKDVGTKADVPDSVANINHLVQVVVALQKSLPVLKIQLANMQYDVSYIKYRVTCKRKKKRCHGRRHFFAHHRRRFGRRHHKGHHGGHHGGHKGGHGGGDHGIQGVHVTVHH